MHIYICISRYIYIYVHIIYIYRYMCIQGDMQRSFNRVVFVRFAVQSLRRNQISSIGAANTGKHRNAPSGIKNYKMKQN